MPGSTARCLWLALLLSCIGLVPAWAQEAPARGHSHGHVLRAAEYDANTFIPPTAPRPGKTFAPTASINVTYQGFTAVAQQAFEYAVNLWEESLTSPVTVQVNASFAELEENVLGSAGPRLTANFAGIARQDTWYPTAIADALIGQNIDVGGADIVASFNSDFDRWYFGLDGNPPSGMYDFVTVVLHELGHGLGFTGSFDVVDGDDDEECQTDEVGFGCWGLGSTTGRQRYPLLYDRYVEDASDVPLLDTQAYPNPSRRLGDVLQSGAVYFDGESVRLVNEDIPVDLYAPSNFERGSSFSHLDEETFPPGHPHSLMTPFLAAAEAIHSPGAVTCAILSDMGWPLGDGCHALFAAGVSAVEGVVRADDAVVTFRIAPGSEIDSVLIEVGRPGANPDRVIGVDVDVSATALQEFEVEISDLAPGEHIIRLRVVDENHVVLPAHELSLTIPLQDPYLVTGPYPNPAREIVNVAVMVQHDQPVEVEVYDVLGRRRATLFSAILKRNQEQMLPVDLRGWPSGTYFILVRGEDFVTTRQFARVR